MAMVRFASTCDGLWVARPSGRPLRCDARSASYTQWPICRACGQHACPRHQMPGSVRDADVDEPESCVCVACGVREEPVSTSRQTAKYGPPPTKDQLLRQAVIMSCDGPWGTCVRKTSSRVLLHQEDGDERRTLGSLLRAGELRAV